MDEKKKITYTEAQKRAIQKYRLNNKEKVSEQYKKYYENRKARDPSYLEYKRNKSKEYYKKKNNVEEHPKEHLDLNKLQSIFSVSELGRLIDETFK